MPRPMTRRFAVIAAALAMALAVPGVAPRALAQDAADPAVTQIEGFYAVLTQSMKGGSQMGVQGRYKLLEPAVQKAFNLPAMTGIVVGPTLWDKMQDADKKALTDAFTRLTVANYASQFSGYNGQVFKVDPKVQTRGADRIVTSTMTSGNGKPVTFIYRMRDAGGGDWKVIDILLAGSVSQLATKRSEFASTLSSGGAAALAAKMNQTADAQLK